MHDAYRVDKGGKPTFDRVMSGLDVLKRHQVDWNVLTTIHAVNGDHGRAVYTFLRDELGASVRPVHPDHRARHRRDAAHRRRRVGPRVKGRPLYTQDGNLVTHRSVGPAQYGRFLIDVFEEWVRRDIGTVYVQMFDTALANWYGERGGMCVHAETCGIQLALEHTGDLYSCDHYVEPGYLLGNIKDKHLLELIVLPQQRQIRAGQARHPDPVLPGLRRPVRLQRRLPEGPVRHLTLRRTRPALPLPQLPGVLPARPQADGNHEPAPPVEPCARRAHAHLCQAGRPARPQRAVHLRHRP